VRASASLSEWGGLSGAHVSLSSKRRSMMQSRLKIEGKRVRSVLTASPYLGTTLPTGIGVRSL